MAEGSSLLSTSGPGWLDTARVLLWRAGHLGFDKRLSLGRHEDVDLVGLTPSYSSVLKAWQIFKHVCTKDETPGVRLFDEPLSTTF